MATAKDVMSIAASYIGTHEDPLGSNNVIFNTDYYSRPVSGADYPWCCAFVWDIFRMAGASELFYNGQRTAYCPTVAAWGSPNAVPYEQAEYGDLVLFDWDGDGVADHIGFVVGLNSDGSMETIEGNTSDADHSNGGYVLGRQRYKSSVCMVIRIQYEALYMFEVSEIKLGDTGKNVYLAQALLRGRGYRENVDGGSRKQLKIDSSFGARTENAVRYFQKKNNIPETGVVDCEATWPALLRR